jgi:hypothetical protein
MALQRLMSAEEVAIQLSGEGQEVITLGQDAYIVRGEEIDVCVLNDCGALTILFEDVTDNVEYELICQSAREA